MLPRAGRAGYRAAAVVGGVVKRPYVWIVEMVDWRSTGKWCPTVGCALSRDAGREEMTRWRINNPTDDFRLRKYVKERK